MVHNFVAQIEVEIIVMTLRANFEYKTRAAVSKKMELLNFLDSCS